MATIKGQVRAASDAIETNISMITADRGFLSKNVLQYLRDLIEAMVVWAHTGNPELRFTGSSRKRVDEGSESACFEE
jgi:hypothetical protein